VRVVRGPSAPGSGKGGVRMYTTATSRTILRAAPLELLLAVLAALALSIALSLAVGLPAAYAGEAGAAADGAAGEESPALDQAGAVGGNAVGTSTGGQAAGASNSATSALDGQSGSSGADVLQGAADGDVPGLNAPYDMTLWLSPTGVAGTQVANSDDILVELTCAVGEGVYLSTEIDRVRIGDKDTKNGDTVTLQTYPDNGPGLYKYILEPNPNGGEPIVIGMNEVPSEVLQIKWYKSQTTTLSQGTYSDKGTTQTTASPSLGNPTVTSSSTGSLGGANAYAVNYMWVYDYTNGAVKDSRNTGFNTYEEVPAGAGFVATGTENVRKAVLPLDTSWTDTWESLEFYFDEPGEYYYTAQATLGKVFTEWVGPEYGGYWYEWHAVNASNRVTFKITVTEPDRTTLTFKAKDPEGKDVDLTSGFSVTCGKKIKNTAGSAHIGEEQYPSYDWWTYFGKEPTYFGKESSGATAGTYKVKIVSTTGLTVPYEEEFTISAAQAAGATFEKLVTIVPKGYIPQYSVTFVTEDGGTVLLEAKKYNEDTFGGLVEVPASVPVKAEDDDYVYVHQGWVIEGSGRWVSGPENVTRNVTYKAYYKAIPKNNVFVSPLRVVASGGLYALESKPAGVVSYGLQVSTPTAAQSSALASAYAANIGNSKVLGMYNVDVIQHNDDGTDVSLHEGVGDLTLTFPVDGVADGTALRVLQLHENGDSTELIEHTGLVASGGTVDVTLDGRLSTFIILEDLEAQGGDEGDGDGRNDDVDIVPSSSGGSSGAPAGGDTPAAVTPATETPASSASDNVKDFIDDDASVDEPATRAMPADDSKVGEGGLADDGRGEDAPEVVKAGPSADGGKTMPQTGDGSRMPLALVLTALFGVIVLLARGRKAER